VRQAGICIIATLGNLLICRRPGVVSARCGALGRRLQDTELVAVRVRQDVPAPSVLDHGVVGEQGRAEAEDPLGLPLQAAGEQVQVQPVLLVLVIGWRCSSTSMPWPSPGIRLRYVGLSAGPATYPSTPAQNRADWSRSEQSITITSSPFR